MPKPDLTNFRPDIDIVVRKSIGERGGEKTESTRRMLTLSPFMKGVFLVLLAVLFWLIWSGHGPALWQGIKTLLGHARIAA